MPDSSPLFVHPLLGTDDAWGGFYVETVPEKANSEALGRLAVSPLLAEFDQRLPWFLPALADCDQQATVIKHPVFVFPARPTPGEADALAQREGELRRAGHKVGLIATPIDKLPGTGAWDYLLIDIGHARSLPPFTLHGMASRTTVVATGVASQADRHWTHDNACALTTGEFLLTRASPSSKADITRMKLLKLLSLIDSDANTDALDDIFREEGKLAYSLLRLVNSAAMAPRSQITSYSQAINLLGRRQLQRWLQLLVYSDPNNGQHPNPLLQKAAARGRLLELLAGRLAPADPVEWTGDTAFMIGTFSLLDVLLGMPMAEILHQLPLPEIAHNALARHEGPLGQLLGVIDAADKRELRTAGLRLATSGVAGDDFLGAQLEAYSWAAKIRQPA